MKEIPYAFFIPLLPVTTNTAPSELSRSGVVCEQNQTVLMLFHSWLCAAASRLGDKTTHRRVSSILKHCTYIKDCNHLLYSFLKVKASYL